MLEMTVCSAAPEVRLFKQHFEMEPSIPTPSLGNHIATYLIPIAHTEPFTTACIHIAFLFGWTK